VTPARAVADALAGLLLVAAARGSPVGEDAALGDAGAPAERAGAGSLLHPPTKTLTDASSATTARTARTLVAWSCGGSGRGLTDRGRSHREWSTAEFSRSELGCSFEQCSLRHRESVQPSVERFISRAECRLKRTPILLVAPTVDGQKSIAAIPVAIQLGTEEPGGSAEQLSPSTLRSVSNTKRCHGLIRHVVIPDSDEHTGIRPRDDRTGRDEPRRPPPATGWVVDSTSPRTVTRRYHAGRGRSASIGDRASRSAQPARSHVAGEPRPAQARPAAPRGCSAP